jgi:hypothetical protein
MQNPGKKKSSVTMANGATIEKISKDAELILCTINRGVVNIPELKNFLAKAARLSERQARESKRSKLVKEINAVIK